MDAYVNANELGYASALVFLVLSLTCNMNTCTWSSGSGWPFPLLGNNLLFRVELVLIRDCQICFLRYSHQSIPLNLFKSGPK